MVLYGGWPVCGNGVERLFNAVTSRPPFIRAGSPCSRELQADVWEEELVKMRIL